MQIYKFSFSVLLPIHSINTLYHIIVCHKTPRLSDYRVSIFTAADHVALNRCTYNSRHHIQSITNNVNINIV